MRPLSSYQEYKRNTGLVVGWFSNAYSKLFSSSTPTDSKSSQKSSKKIKTPAPPNVETKITVSKLVSMASSVATAVNNGRIRIPNNLLGILDRVIELRSSFFDFHKSLEPSQPSSSQFVENNKKHGYFRDQLVNIFNLFGGPEWKKKQKSTQDNTNPEPISDADIDILSDNMFELLTVDDDVNFDSSSAGNTSNAVKPDDATSKRNAKASAKKTRRAEDFSLEDDEEDKLFFAWLFVEEIKEMREYVSATWEQVAKRELSTIAATVVTLSAIELVKRVEKEFMLNFPGFSNFGDLLLHLDENLSFPVLLGIANQLCVYKILEELCTKHLVHGRVPILPDKPYIFSRDRDDMTPEEQVKEDTGLLLVQFGDWMLLEKYYPNRDSFFEDFVFYFRELRTNITIPPHLVFVCLVVLDAIHACRQSLDLNFRACMDTMQLARNELKLLRQTTIDYRNKKNWDTRLDNLIEWIGKAIIASPNATVSKIETKPTPPFRYLRMNSFLAGVVQTSVVYEMQCTGLNINNNTGFYASFCHLYNMLANEGYLKNRVPFLEKIMDATLSDIFLGKKPTDPFGYVKSFAFLNGIAPIALAKDRIQRKYRPDKEREYLENIKVRYIKDDLSFLQTIFRDTADENHIRRPRFTLENMNKILKFSKLSADRKNTFASMEIGLLDGMKNLATTEIEEKKLGVNFLRVHRLAADALKAVDDAVMGIVNDTFGPAWMECKMSLYTIPGQLAAILAGDTPKFLPQGYIPDVFSKAGKAVDKVLEGLDEKEFTFVL